MQRGYLVNGLHWSPKILQYRNDMPIRTQQEKSGGMDGCAGRLRFPGACCMTGLNHSKISQNLGEEEGREQKVWQKGKGMEEERAASRFDPIHKASFFKTPTHAKPSAPTRCPLAATALLWRCLGNACSCAAGAQPKDRPSGWGIFRGEPPSFPAGHGLHENTSARIPTTRVRPPPVSPESRLASLSALAPVPCRAAGSDVLLPAAVPASQAASASFAAAPEAPLPAPPSPVSARSGHHLPSRRPGRAASPRLAYPPGRSRAS